MLLFSIHVTNKIIPKELEQLLNFVDACKIPKFPISGDLLKKYGYESGEELGKKLKLLEKKWMDNNFVLDDKVLEKSLNKIRYT